MYSVRDLECCRVMDSGRNSKTLEEAVESMWSYFINSQSEFTEEELEEIKEDYGKKEWIEDMDFEFFEHDDPLPEHKELE